MGNFFTKDEDVEELTSSSILSPASKFEDVVSLLCRMSSSVSSAEVMSVIRTVPTGNESNLLGAIAVGSSMTAKKAMNDKVSQLGLNKYDSFKIDESMNFSMYALLGHMLMSYPIADYTKEGAALKVTYMQSIGGSTDLIAFGANGSITGKDVRSEILKKWVGIIGGFDTAKHHNVLAEKFSKILRSRKTTAGKTVGLFTGVIKYMFSIVIYLLNIMRRFLTRIFMFSVLVALANSVLIMMLKEDYTDNAQEVFSMAGLDVNHSNGLLVPTYLMYTKGFPYMYLVAQVISNIGLSIALGNEQEPILEQLSSLLPFTTSQMEGMISNIRDMSNGLLTNSEPYLKSIYEWLRNQVQDIAEITVPDKPPFQPG